MENLNITYEGYNNCKNCNKSMVCKYKDIIEREISKVNTNLKKEEIPLSIIVNLSVDIKCKQWDTNICRPRNKC